MRGHKVAQACRVLMCAGLTAISAPSGAAHAGMDEVSERFLADGRSLAQAGEFESARRYLERAIVADPANALARAWLGVTHNALGNRNAAEKYFLVAMEVDPDHPQVVYLAALADIDAGTPGDARRKLERLRVICGAECPETRELVRALDNAN